MLTSPVVLSTALVTILALAFYFATSVNVGRMRVRHSVKAPACTGHPEFERAFRVQMNTLEQIVVFLPLLWLTALYFSPFPLAAPILGLIWIIGRVLYMTGYMKAPEKRGPGFGICALSQILLLFLALAGVIMALAAVV